MLKDEMVRQGDWLFRRRSFIPVVLLPFAAAALSANNHYLLEGPTADLIYKIGCLLISLFGLGIRFVSAGFAASGTSGRNTRGQVADHLNTSGTYSLCRHPLYAGNILIALGVLLFTKSALLTAAGVCVYFLIYERIIAREEQFLLEEFGETFERWAEKTAMLIPRRGSSWEPSPLSFSLKAGIRSEFYGLTAVVAIMAVLDTLDRSLIEHTFTITPFWIWASAIVLLMFIVLRYLRKHTKLLDRTSRIS